MSILHPSRRHQIDLDCLGEDLDESAEILTYQEDFMDPDPRDGATPRPPPLITPPALEPLRDHEAISPAATETELPRPLSETGAARDSTEGEQSPHNLPELGERKFRVGEEIHTPPIRGETTPLQEEVPGPSSEPNIDTQPVVTRPQRAAAAAAKPTITQMIVDPFHRKKKKK